MSLLGRDHDHIVVGVDGSPPSLAALGWAVRQAALQRTHLEVVTAWPIAQRDGRPGVESPIEARTLAESALSRITKPGDPPAKTWVNHEPDEPWDLLVRRARHALLVVVGPHSRHTLADRLLGTVTEHVLVQAPCPVAVVRSEHRGDSRHHIVVGVDGSIASQTALEWAATQAALTGSKVSAVIAWDWRPEYGVYPYGSDEAHQRAVAEAALADAVGRLPESTRDLVQCEVIRGKAAAVLIKEAQDADLLVVGNNRPRHLASHVLGSTSRKAATHATVPVVVTHGPADADDR